jgi:hypothetical protein
VQDGEELSDGGSGVAAVSCKECVQRGEGLLGDEVRGTRRARRPREIWLREHPDFEIIDMIVTQSSDAEFHGVTISVFYFERLAPRVER